MLSENKILIKKLLRESLDEAIKKQTFTVYHGSPTEIKNFTDEFVGSDEATDQEGPGIYFTTSLDDATGYSDGGFIYSVKLSPRLLYDESVDKAVPEKLLLKLAMMAPDWKSKAQNFAENPIDGVKQMVSGAYDYNDNEKDVLLQIWIEFYRYDGVEFIRNCVKLGIDGIIVNRHDGVKHVIIYNPTIIDVLDIKKI